MNPKQYLGQIPRYMTQITFIHHDKNRNRNHLAERYVFGNRL